MNEITIYLYYIVKKNISFQITIKNKEKKNTINYFHFKYYKNII